MCDSPAAAAVAREYMAKTLPPRATNRYATLSSPPRWSCKTIFNWKSSGGQQFQIESLCSKQCETRHKAAARTTTAASATSTTTTKTITMIIVIICCPSLTNSSRDFTIPMTTAPGSLTTFGRLSRFHRVVTRTTAVRRVVDGGDPLVRQSCKRYKPRYACRACVFKGSSSERYLPIDELKTI